MVFFAIQMVGVFYSNDSSIGFSYATRNIVFLIFPIVFINLSRILDYAKFRMAMYGLAVGVLVILLSIHGNILFKIFKENLGLDSLLTHFVRVNFVQEGLVEIHPPYFGLLTVFSMVIIFQSQISYNKTANAFIKSALLLYLLVSLYGISSFMPILLLILSLAVYIIFLLKKGKKMLVFIIFACVLTTLILLGKKLNREVIGDFPGSSLVGRIEWSFVRGKGDTSRPENWKSVSSVIKENWFLGVGSDGGLNYLQEHRSPKSESFKNKHNAHNQYLETWLRHGILGLLVYLLAIYLLASKAIRSKDVVFCSFIFFFLVSSITESYLVRQMGSTFFTFYASLFSAIYRINNQ